MASAMSDPCELFVCTTMVYIGAMATSKQVRRSVTLPAQVVRQIERIAKRRRLSDNRVLVELIEEGIEARQQKEKAFFELAEKFRAANDPDQVKQLGDQLGQFVFGE
jgi:predicted DNA-binding ribbon-helix-helix protein